MRTGLNSRTPWWHLRIACVNKCPPPPRNIHTYTLQLGTGTLCKKELKAKWYKQNKFSLFCCYACFLSPTHHVLRFFITQINPAPNMNWASLAAQTVKTPPAIWETQVWSLGWEDPLQEGTATHYSILAWRIPWTEEPGGHQCMGSQRVRHEVRGIKKGCLWPRIKQGWGPVHHVVPPYFSLPNLNTYRDGMQAFYFQNKAYLSDRRHLGKIMLNPWKPAIPSHN